MYGVSDSTLMICLLCVNIIWFCQGSSELTDIVGKNMSSLLNTIANTAIAEECIRIINNIYI